MKKFLAIVLFAGACSASSSTTKAPPESSKRAVCDPAPVCIIGYHLKHCECVPDKN